MTQEAVSAHSLRAELVRAGRIACDPGSAQAIFKRACKLVRSSKLLRGLREYRKPPEELPDQARLRRRWVCRRVLWFERVSRRSSVERVASISETVLRIPLRRWAVWNQGLIDFMLEDSTKRSGLPATVAAIS
jgi:hypothetical protein